MFRSSVALAVALLATTSSFATITWSSSNGLNSITVEDNAFADTVLSYSGVGGAFIGSFTASPSAAQINQALTDKAGNTFVNLTGAGSLTMGFTDNTMGNGAGADLAVFTQGSVNRRFDLTINGVTRTYNTQNTNYVVSGALVDVAFIDLSDFGVALNAPVSQFVVKNNPIVSGSSTTNSSFVDFAALNAFQPIPEPSTIIAGIVLAFIGLTVARRLRK